MSDEKKPSVKPYDFRRASALMGHNFTNTSYFIINAIEWLAAKYGDIHLEYHEDDGWQVSTCYADGNWGEDGWVRGDGSLATALAHALEISHGTDRKS